MRFGEKLEARFLVRERPSHVHYLGQQTKLLTLHSISQEFSWFQLLNHLMFGALIWTQNKGCHLSG